MNNPQLANSQISLVGQSANCKSANISPENKEHETHLLKRSTPFSALSWLNHQKVGCRHGQMNYKDTKPYMSAFLSVDLLTEFAAFCLTDFIDWRYIHSWFVFSTQLVNCCPLWTKELYGTCVLLPLYCTFSLTSSPLPPFPMYSIQTVCDCGGGGGMIICTVDNILQEHSVYDQIQNLQNCFTTPNKMTSEDDIKGLVSFKFLRPWLQVCLAEFSM